MRTAAQGAVDEPYHVLNESDSPSSSGKPLCGTRAYAIVSLRADHVPLHERCVLTGCFQAWPVTQAEVAYDRTVMSAWGLRRATDLARAGSPEGRREAAEQKIDLSPARPLDPPAAGVLQ